MWNLLADTDFFCKFLDRGDLAEVQPNIEGLSNQCQSIISPTISLAMLPSKRSGEGMTTFCVRA